MKFNGIIVVALIAALGLFTGCGSEEAPKEGTNSEDTTGGADNNTDMGGTDNNTDNGTTDNNTDMGGTDNNTDIGGSGGGNSTDCTQAGSNDACINCFIQADPAGFQAYNTAITTNCLCANECQDSCTSECGGQQGDGSCQTCLDGLGQDSACGQGFSASCQADQACLSLVMNLQSCPQ